MSDGARTGAVIPLPKPSPNARKQRKAYRPWRHAGTTLGHVRGDTY